MSQKAPTGSVPQARNFTAIDRQRFDAFWHNFRLTRSRLRGSTKAARHETYALLRGGIFLAGLRAISSTPTR
jgi:hypothetical protein